MRSVRYSVEVRGWRLLFFFFLSFFSPSAASSKLAQKRRDIGWEGCEGGRNTDGRKEGGGDLEHRKVHPGRTKR